MAMIIPTIITGTTIIAAIAPPPTPDGGLDGVLGGRDLRSENRKCKFHTGNR